MPARVVPALVAWAEINWLLLSRCKVEWAAPDTGRGNFPKFSHSPYHLVDFSQWQLRTERKIQLSPALSLSFCMKYTLTAHLPKPRSGRNEKTLLRSQLKSISGTPMSNLSGCPAKNMGVQAVFIFGVPKWGSGPPRGAFWTKFQFFGVPAHDLCTEVPPCEFGPFPQIIHASRAFVVISGQICLQGRLWGISGMGLLTEKLF